MIESIEMLINALNENGIRYCHWKSNEHLDRALEGDTDLDILFDPTQRRELEQVLDSCGLKRFRATPLMQYNAIEDFIGFDQKNAKIWHLHTHYRMTLGEKHLKGYTVTPWTDIILENRRKSDSGIYCSSFEHELVLLIVRITMKLRIRDYGKALGKDDRTELMWLLQRSDINKVNEAALAMLDDEAAEILVTMLKTELVSKNQFRKLHRKLLVLLKPFTGYSRLGSRYMRSKRELFWLVGGVKRRLHLNSYVANRRISPSGGTVVAVIGSDGAGKSTTLSYVRKEFNKKIDTIVIYFGSGDGSSSLLRMPMKIVAKKVGGKGLGERVEKSEDKAEHTSSKRKGIKAVAYSVGKFVWAVTLAKEKEAKLKQMTRARNNGLLVLTDRYPQHEFPGCNDGPLLNKYYGGKGLLAKISNWEYNVYKSASYNKPDVAIKLIAPPEVALERKPDMTLEKIEQKINIVQSLNIAERTVVIDTSRDFDVTRGEVMKAIWDII